MTFCIWFARRKPAAIGQYSPLSEQPALLRNDRTPTVRLPLALAAALVALPVAAQQPPSPGSLPETLPFNIPYGAPIGLAQARALVDAAVAEAGRRGWPLNVAVVDTNGDLVAFARMDGAMLASVGISQRKARTAARFRRETRVFFDAMEKGHANVATLGPDVVASPGGFPLVVGGKLVGAIGCSGGTGDQDAAVCKIAVDGLK